ncbi:PIG-L family deacetylase [Alphaproteobacteria bacterium]|nr:PIG-L family deacetylase [Alphaproteobacteria bacterium]
MKILAIGAHPDDIEIFMYGLLAACKKRGDEIISVVATDGAAGNYIQNKDLKKTRMKESKIGLKNISKPIFLDLEDGNLSGSHNAKKIVYQCIDKHNPDLIITHDVNDYHSDHRALSEIIIESSGYRYPVLLSDTLMGVNFNPEFYVDITDHINEKHQAIMAHKSQNPIMFSEAAKLMNRFRSAQCNGPENHYAEAYKTVKKFPIVNIGSMLPPSPKLRKFYNINSDGFL